MKVHFHSHNTTENQGGWELTLLDIWKPEFTRSDGFTRDGTVVGRAPCTPLPCKTVTILAQWAVHLGPLKEDRHIVPSLQERGKINPSYAVWYKYL